MPTTETNAAISRTVRRLVLVALVRAGALRPAFAQETPFPQTHEFVNDWANVLSSDEVQRLTTLCRDFQTKDGYQLLIVTLATLNGEDINHAATRFGNEMKAGRAGKDTGVVLMLAMQEHQVYIATGSGTEAVLTDARAARITRDVMRPLLREGRTGDAVMAGAQQIVAVIEGGGEVEPMPIEDGGGHQSGGGIPVTVLLGIGGIFTLIALASRAALKCPRCGHLMTIHNEVVEQPGLLSNGYGIRKRTCPNCGFSDSSRYTIYRSGGGGFFVGGGGGGWSGGSSSGGGWSGGGGGFSGGGGSFGGGGGGSSW